MRRLPPLLLLCSLTSCTGFGEFLNHAFSLPGTNPNIPMADSENVRRALGTSRLPLYDDGRQHSVQIALPSMTPVPTGESSELLL